MLIECWCNALPSRASVFERLLVVPIFKSSKRYRSCCLVVFSEEEYPKETVNMVGSGRALKTIPHFNSSDHEQEQAPQGVYQFTRNSTNQVIPVDYTKINAEAFRSDIGPFGLHHAIVESFVSSSFNKGNASVCMIGTSNEIAH